jgi:DNA invertase Pin-like site-specific DNA recombinase
MRYIIYLRVSTDKQDTQVQHHHCINYLKNNHLENLDLPKFVIFCDDDVSARKVKLDKRIGLQDALNTLKAGDTFVAIALDRLGRNILECAQIREIIKQKKCTIIFVNQPWIGDNDILWGMMSGVASEEVKTLRLRTRNGMSAKRAQGKFVGNAPYGYKMITHPTELTKKDKPQKYLQINPSEKVIIDLMHDLKSQGFSFREITDELNRQGITNRHGRKWQSSLVHMILRNHKHQPQESALQSLCAC